MREDKKEKFIIDLTSKELGEIGSFLSDLDGVPIDIDVKPLMVSALAADKELTFKMLWLVDLIECLRDVGVEDAIDEHNSKLAIIEGCGSLTVPSPAQALENSKPSDASEISFLLDTLDEQLFGTQRSNDSAYWLDLVRQFLLCPTKDLTSFIGRHPKILSMECIALAGIVKILAGKMPKAETFIRRRRLLLRNYSRRGPVIALGEYYGLTFQRLGHGNDDDDPFLDSLADLSEGGRLRSKERSAIVKSVATARLIRKAVKDDSVTLEERWTEIASLFHSLLSPNQPRLFSESLKRLDAEIINWAPSSAHSDLLSNLFWREDNFDEGLSMSLTEAATLSLDWQELPKVVPTVKIAEHGENDSADDIRLDLSVLDINTPTGLLRLPFLVDYRLSAVHKLGPYQTVLVKNCISVGPVLYKHIMYVYREDEPQPCLVLASETNRSILEETKQANELAPDGYEVVLPLFFGLFTANGHSNLGLSVDWGSLEKFRIKAHALIQEFFNVPDEPISIDSDAQLEMINQCLDQVYSLIEERKYTEAAKALPSIRSCLRSSAYRNSLSRTLLYLTWCCTELGDIDHATTYALDGLALEQVRSNHNSQAVYLFELSKLYYIKGDLDRSLKFCRRAITRKLTTETWHSQGLARYRNPFNDAIDGELLLLAVILREIGDTASAVEALRFCKIKCEIAYNSALLGECLDELGTTLLETGNHLSGVECLLDALWWKLRSSYQGGIRDSLIRFLTMSKDLRRLTKVNIQSSLNKGRGFP